ncbi:MAG: hypothetical protein KAF91_02580 [Nostoc sp. TH1S01]|nr:hypothetical protein [Nostoc sp. TH1S01]
MKLIYLNFYLLKLNQYSLIQKKLIEQLDSLAIKFLDLMELGCDGTLNCQSDRLWHQTVVLTSTYSTGRPLQDFQLLLRS